LDRIVRDNSAFEDSLQPFVDAANAPGPVWKEALKLFYINGSVMVLSEFSTPVFVSLHGGKPEDVANSLSLITGKATTGIIPFISSIMKTVLPIVTEFASNPDVTQAAEKDGEEAVAKIMIPIIKSFGQNFDIAKRLIQSGFTFSDFFAVGIFETLSKFRAGQVHVMTNDEEYEKIILLLRKLEVANPRLQVGVCPNCANYQLILSKHSHGSEHCQQCGYPWTTITLYTLEERFSKLKAQNLDLPIFISAYLRHRLAPLTAMQEVRIHPSAVLQVSKKKQEEIDVYLPEFKTAFECKVVRDPLGAFTGPHAGSLAGELKKKITSLTRLGVTNVIVVTNLPDESAKKLTEELLSDQQLKARVTVVPAQIQSLISTLDGLSDMVGQQISDSFGRRIAAGQKKEPSTKNEPSKKGDEASSLPPPN
jgi:hypothetical protein